MQWSTADTYAAVGTMCRKWTSSLVAQFIVVRPEQLERQLETYTTYREFESSPRRFRGFCGQCGTSLIWRSADKPALFDLFLGTVDEKWLVGEKGVPGCADVGRTLATPNGTQFWMENAIKGITDLLAGGKEYSKEGADGLGMVSGLRQEGDE